MSFVNVPNIPQNRVKSVLVDGRIDKNIEAGFEKNGISVIKTELYPALYAAVSYHPDIVFHHLGGNRIIHAPDTSINVIKRLSGLGFELVAGNSELCRNYPGNIRYNAARVGNIAFHNTKYTDAVLRENLENMGVELVHVNQGYAKCSVSIVDENSIITMDKGIARTAEAKGLEVLVIEEENIRLPGLDKGFIGGSTGLLDRNKWAITGNIEKLASFYKVYDFLHKKGIEIVCLSKEDVIDIGSIIPIITV
ncbi:MAG: hypothetical protein GX660_06195 [Clostridiaceae bacterium]|nr:hypothetical protein [Clostridiaceae bacterium]